MEDFVIAAREVGTALMVARAVTVILGGIGGVSFIVGLVFLRQVRHDKAEGNIETAAMVKRNGLIAVALGVLLFGIGYVVWGL
ncbi:hypothetical protein [Streptomyces sp. NPDC046805]|uniref:hypothetical protein n=1 Tax=Streptomyces sp. NPDC046805 TaxID=3155134 RepID=UPI00340E3140